MIYWIKPHTCSDPCMHSNWKETPFCHPKGSSYDGKYLCYSTDSNSFRCTDKELKERIPNELLLKLVVEEKEELFRDMLKNILKERL
ncbi:unnamed protein product [marine sediment metagenome]|uniref:Uncharacterized protein n=1 Tax=marine sediment metagenome TaxID=412755 RepID=X0T295_9ZZZZ